MERLTKKCSTFLISVGEDTHVYHSVEEIPQPLREQLIETTQGMNSITILIADKGGREELLKAVRQSSLERHARMVGSLLKGPASLPRQLSRWETVLPVAGRVLLVGCFAYVLWILAGLR